MKVVDAGRFADIAINETEWEHILKTLDAFRAQGYWGEFAAQASRIKTLAAE
jgi:hypothetical protein